jgi:cGMP-dependent protein kinase
LKNVQEKIDYDLIAQPDCLLVECEVEILTKTLGGSLMEMMGKSNILETLQKVHLFKNFTLKKLEILAEKIGVERYENGKKIITQGEEGSKFYIVKSGKVDIFVNSNYIRTINENEYFGERALFFKEARSATAVANGPVEIQFLDKEDFKSNIEANLKDYLMNRLYLQDNTIELKDLDYLQPLGSGNYGQVSLVQNRKNKFLYAIKGIAKKQIDFEQLHKNLELERAILLQIDHPFIVKLVKTLKDSRYVYFLMEHIKGKELFDVIRDIGLLNKYQTQFYAASMMLAVEYLHERKFIYRDIKPENIIVVENVRLKLLINIGIY